MKKVVALVVLGAAVAACDAPKETSTVSSVFEKNCETIRTVVDNLQKCQELRRKLIYQRKLNIRRTGETELLRDCVKLYSVHKLRL